MLGPIRLGAVALAIAALAPAIAVAPAPAAAATAIQAIANLNAQRAANGIPAGITENPSSSAGCAAHDNYERMNGGALTHSETPGNPGYTTAGDQAAGDSVLAEGTDWDTANPWQTAPIHLAQLLDPYLDEMGVDDSDGFVCATTLAPDAGFRAGPASIAGYSYPGDGQVNWPAAETAAEGPFTPGDLVGLPQPAMTGPYLFVLFAGPWPAFTAPVTLSSATLTGPGGPVAVKTVDGTTPTPAGIPLGDYIGSEAMLIPPAPLTAGATYTAQANGTVTYDGTTQPVSERFSFTTAISPMALRAESRLTLSRPRRRRSTLSFTLSATGAYLGRRAQVHVRVGRRIVRAWKTRVSAKSTITLNHSKHATVSITVASFTTDAVRFRAITVKRSS
jgi:hypothetical protein